MPGPLVPGLGALVPVLGEVWEVPLVPGEGCLTDGGIPLKKFWKIFLEKFVWFFFQKFSFPEVEPRGGDAGGTPLAVTQENFLVLQSE